MKVKRNIFIKYALIILLSAPNTLYAFDFEVDGIYYSFNKYKSSVGVTSGDVLYKGVVIIPSEVSYNGKSYEVTSVNSYAFKDCSDLTSVTISKNVSSFSDHAFHGCSNLNSIRVEVDNQNYDSRDNCNAIIETSSNTLVAGCNSTIIPNSVTSIGGSAFYGCRSLTSITIPNSVISIGDFAFSFCDGLISVSILNGVKSIGAYAFSNCSGLTLLTIPNSVTEIGNYAFNGCSVLPNITIPNSVTSIGEYAFQNCSGLRSVIIQKGLTSIGYCAFIYCSGLTSVTIPNSVTSIGDCAFEFCSSLNYIEIPNSVTTIGTNAFGWCSGLTNITIPNNVTYIGNGAFYLCKELASLTIPNSLKTIGSEAFSLCRKLKSVVSLIEKPFPIDEDVFKQIPSSSILQVPKGTKQLYQQTQGWSSVFSSIEEISTAEVFSLSINSLGNGSVSYGSTNIKNETKSFQLEEGNSANITISPDKGYRIKSVKVNSEDVTSSVTNNSYTLSNIKANTTVEVEFEAIPIPTYTLSVKASGNGSATYNGTTAKNNTQTFTLNEGTSATITFAPDNGYRIKSVKVNSVDVTSSVSNNSYTVSNIKANTTVEVEFEAIPIPTYTLSVKAIGNGSATYNGTTAKNNTQTFTLNEGTSATITFAPDNGHRIKNVKVNNADVTSSVSNNSYTVSNIKSNTTVEVEFEAIPINSYTLKYVVDGVTYRTYQIQEGATITPEAMPTKEGYTFSGWSEIPQIMPSMDVTVTGSFIVNKYKLTYQVDGVEYKSYDVEYGATITPEAFPTKDGYTFSGWSEIPKTMPAKDVTVVGTFTKDEPVINTYTLTLTALGNGTATFNNTTAKNDSKTFTLNEGTSATIAFSPDNGYRIKSVKVNSTDVTSSVSNNSYTVSNIKSNTTVEVEFEAIPINSYTLKYVVDGVTYRTYQIQEGATITPEAMPTKEGYTFSGWSEIPQIMPSMDVTVTGSFIVNKYKLTYQVDGVEYKSYDVEYGATITPEAFPTKDGYTFSGWSEIPKTMPAKDVTVVGTFTKDEPVINTYTLTLTALGNGTATFNNTTAKNDSKTFTLNEETSATIAFTPDNGYRIKSVKVNSVDVTSSVSNNSYTVSNIKDNTTVNVEFEAIPTTDTTPISGDKFEVDGITYVVNNDVNTVSVTSGNAKYSGDVAIPSSVVYLGNTYSVTSIGSWAFAFCDELTSVTIPNSVTFIDMDAFQECSLTSITIPNSVTDIRFEAFRNCSLTSVTIPSSVSSIGYGAFFGCDLTTITSEIENPFEIEESVFDGIPSDAQLIVPKGTKAAYQATEGWNQFANIVEAGDAEPDQPGQIHINDILYKVTGTGEVEVVSAENGVTSITIPSSLSYNNTVYKVTSIAKDAFETCEHLSAVIWEPEAQFNAKVNNPNFLLYVSDEKYASRSVKNVVVNSVAESIELTDAANGNDFYCPRAFSARNIVYSHNYQMETGIGDSRGWETIVLPFDVQKYTHATKGELESFTTWTQGSNKKPFWLFELTASGYKDVAGIKANTPYIISMPNNPQYLADYVIIGLVTFSAENVEVKASDDMLSANYQDRTFVPNYTNKAGDDYLALNVNSYYVTNPGTDIDGSKFIKGLRAVHPFEAYMTTTSNTRSIDVMDGMTTAIRNIMMTAESKDVIKVYDTKGVLVKTAKANDELRKGLAAGVYIVNGKKMIIK